MKTIKLRRLTLDHFQGGSIVIDVGGDLWIYGMNSSGKTRLVSAVSWLLWGKDSSGRTDFALKDLNSEGEVAERGIDHTVEAVLSVDGEEITLKKVFREKWTKARGRAEATFSGHSTQHFVNSIPKSEKEYKEIIAEIAGAEETFRLLTSPTCFSVLPWQRQRSILLDVVGDLTPEDVIASDPNLTPLTGLLQKFKSSKTPFDDLRKTITIRRTEINKELPNISVRIDEVRRGLPDVTGIDRKAEEADAKRLETALNDAKLRLQGINTSGNIAALSAKLARINLDLQNMEKDHRSKSQSILNGYNQDISEVEAKLNASRRRLSEIEIDLKLKARSIGTADAILDTLRKQWVSVDAETFKNTISDICPACGQALPADRVQAAREKALAQFNENKADRLGEINSKGHDLKEQRDRLRGELEALQNERVIVTSSIHESDTKLMSLTQERDALKASSEDYSGVPGYHDLLDESEAVSDQIVAEKEGNAQDTENIEAEISALETDLSSKKARVDLFARREQGEKRMEELKASEKTLAAEYEKLEGELYLIEQFIKTKVSLLTDRINGKFKINDRFTVQFKLFNVQINGGIEDCCEIMVSEGPGKPLVGYNSGLNNAAKIQAGIVIINTLQQHYGLSVPIFVDNRESVTDLPPLNCQVISLVVSPEDKVLRIETAPDKGKQKPAKPVRQGTLRLGEERAA